MSHNTQAPRLILASAALAQATPRRSSASKHRARARASMGPQTPARRLFQTRRGHGGPRPSRTCAWDPRVRARARMSSSSARMSSSSARAPPPAAAPWLSPPAVTPPSPPPPESSPKRAVVWSARRGEKGLVVSDAGGGGGGGVGGSQRVQRITRNKQGRAGRGGGGGAERASAQRTDGHDVAAAAAGVVAEERRGVACARGRSGRDAARACAGRRAKGQHEHMRRMEMQVPTG